MEKSFEIADLIIKTINGTINAGETQELDKWLSETPENIAVYNKAIDTKSQLNKLEVYQLFEKEKAWSAIEEKLFTTKTIRFGSRRMLLYAAAILIPVLITTSIALLYFGNKSQPTLASIDSVIRPGSQKAVLILSDGGTVELDQEEILDDLKQGDVQIKNENNSLIYSDKTGKRKKQPLIFNELKTPKGGGYNLNLADGTKVWLNAGSSLKFPASFSDSTRHVYLEGEAYFEVSHNGKPFIVSSGSMDVRVLGTSFNVLAYPDEQELVTTLIEGKVKIQLSQEDEPASSSRILSPDDQAIINRDESRISVSQVNTSQYTSWIDGKFEFNNEDLDIVMKRLARWYDFEYEFKNIQAKEFHFSARINNTESISTILEMLEMTTDVKFELKENTIVVI
jgi:transmembrane sensor